MQDDHTKAAATSASDAIPEAGDQTQVRVTAKLAKEIDQGAALFGCSNRNQFIEAAVRAFMDRNAHRYQVETMALMAKLEDFHRVVELLAQSSVAIAEIAALVESKHYQDLAAASRRIQRMGA